MNSFDMDGILFYKLRLRLKRTIALLRRWTFDHAVK